MDVGRFPSDDDVKPQKTQLKQSMRAVPDLLFDSLSYTNMRPDF